MPVIRSADAPTFDIPGVTIQALAAPSRGATETCAWHFQAEPGASGDPHSVTREEVFVALEGSAVATIDGQPHNLDAGDALVVPADVMFHLSNPGDAPFRAIAVLPVGAEVVAGGQAFAPPWMV